MSITRAQKSAALARGAAEGGTVVATLGAAATAGMKALSTVAPVAAKVAARAVPVAAAGLAAVGAAKAAVASSKRGEGVKDIAKHAALGAIGLDDAVSKIATTPPAPGWSPPMKLGGPKGPETESEARKRVGQRLGDPRDLELAAQVERKRMQQSKSSIDRERHERRALALEAQYKAETGKHIGPTLPDPPPQPAKEPPKPAESFGKRMLRKAEDAIEGALFGEKKAKADDALTTRRKALDKEIGDIRAEMADEAKTARGPKYRSLQERLDKKQAEIAGVTAQQTAKEAEETAAFRQVGALVAGATVGGVLGKMTSGAAHKAAAAAETGIAKLADKAARIIKASPKGVIAGTIEGDKAAAAVQAAKAAAAKPGVSKVEAYALPALNVTHGVGMIAMASADKDNPAAPLMRMEGTGAVAAGVIGAKFGVAARAVRAVVSPESAGKLRAVEKRLAREASKGPAAVAQARASKEIAGARAAAGVAVAKGRADVAQAQVRGSRDIAAARIAAGRDVGVAKASAGARVERAEIRAKGAASREAARQNAQGPGYKDVWIDKKGRKYHRKDMSVRKAGAAGPANDNATAAARAAK